MGANTRRALWRYLEKYRRDAAPNDPIFLAERGHRAGERLTAGGVGQLITRLAEVAGISGVRCSPHTFRHTFAITFLRNGGNVLELKALLGHEDLKMVNRYVALASVDLADEEEAGIGVDLGSLWSTEPLRPAGPYHLGYS